MENSKNQSYQYVRLALTVVPMVLLTCLSGYAINTAMIGELPIPGSSTTSEQLTLSQSGIVLENDQTTLVWTSAGDLLLYFYSEEVLWHTGTDGKGKVLEFGDNGILAIKNSSDKVIWSTEASGGQKLVLQGDRNLVMRNDKSDAVWASHTDVTKLHSSDANTVSAESKEAQDFMVPQDITSKYISLHAEGADGGKRQVKEAWGTTRFTVKGGAGATIKGLFEIGTGSNQIPPGSIVRFIVGQKGSTRTGQTTAGCEGGGGTAVFCKKPNEKEWHMLLAAGGGGGAYSDCCLVKNPGKEASTSTSGSKGGGSYGTAGGLNGSMGSVSTSTGWGMPGAGAYGNQTTEDFYVDRLKISSRSLPKAGWPDGDEDSSTLPIGGDGGAWGFGAGGQKGTSGGGGGGYSGGGAGATYDGGGGGGSYVSDMAVKNIKQANGTTSDTKHGFVIYQFFDSSSSFK